MSIGDFVIRDVATIRDGILRVIRNGLIARGVTNPDVSPASDYYLIADGLATELTVGEANAVIKVDAFMPDSAIGDELKRWLASVGLQFRTAIGSVGNVSMQTDGNPSPVGLGDLLIDDAGLSFSVTVGGTYNDGDAVPVVGVSAGYATNHINGDILKWVAPPAFAKPEVTVGLVGGTDGLIDGVDDENEESARARLLDRLANPPSGYNWEQVAEIAADASPTVQKAFVYPALQGPASLQVVVVGFSTAFLAIAGPSAIRAIDPTIVSSTITPYIKGILPSSIAVSVLTTFDIATDVSIGLNLPAAPTGSPAGPGGGWLDGSPWPAVSGSSYTQAVVTAVTSSLVFTVDAPTAPTAGVSRITFVRGSNWTVYSAKVVSFTGTGPFALTVDTPMTGISVGDFVFPQSVRQAAYVTALLTAFAQMGPGEKTAVSGILERAFRHPTPSLLWPSSLGASHLRAIEDTGAEVGSTSWLYRSTTTPPVPGTPASLANILIPRRLAFYPL